MKKTLLILMILLIAASAFAQPKLLKPVDPAILGRGNTVIADPGGYQSFFNNPAGFAKDDQFTILSLNPWLFTDKATVSILTSPEEKAAEIATAVQPGQPIGDDIAAWLAPLTNVELEAILTEIGVTAGDIALAGGTDAYFASLSQADKITVMGILFETPGFPVTAEDLGLPSGSARVGTSMGIAYTGGGLGLGLFGIVDAELNGDNIMTAEGTATAQLSLHAGYAMTFDLDVIKIHAGIQARPTIKFSTTVDASFIPEVMSGGTSVFATLADKPGNVSAGVGIDIGVIVDVWWFEFGVSAMNILSISTENPATINQISADPGMLLPDGSIADNLVKDISLNFGIGFHPVIPGISEIIDPAVYIDFQDINGVIEAVQDAADGEEAEALLKLVKVGVDVKLLNFLRAKVGYADGYFTVGAGLELSPFHVSVAATFGALSYDEVSDFGIAAEVAIRF